MKKLFMLGLLATAMCAGATTLELQTARPQLMTPAGIDMVVEAADAVESAPMRLASDELEYCLHGKPQSALSYRGQTAGLEVAMAFELTSDAATMLAGDQLTQISFYTGQNSLTKNNRIKSATVFLTYDLTEEPFYTQQVECPKTAYTQVVAELETPYNIEAGKAVFVGVMETITHAKDQALVVDYIGHEGDEGGWIAYKDEEGWAWDNVASGYGFVCVGALVKGPNIPHNKASLSVYSVSSSVVEVGKTFDTQWLIRNNGADPLTSITLRVTVGDLAPQDITLTADSGIGFAQAAIATVQKLSYPRASETAITVKGEVVSVNGKANTSDAATAELEVDVIPVGSGFSRNVVVEEFTGTWCSYCPRGIVVMEKIREDYPDGKLIPVTIHTGDEMQSDTYIPVSQYGGNGVPSVVFNRDVQMYPWTYQNVIDAALSVAETPAVAKVNATAEIVLESANEIKVKTVTNFANKSDKADQRFVLSFGVTQDYVGPYTQQNSYSGDPAGTAGGWENLPGEVSVMYNDVARYLDTFEGIPGSIPAQVQPGVDYEYEHTLTLPQVVVDEVVTDIPRGHCNVVVYIIEKLTGKVHNAFTVKATQLGNNAGVDNVAVDNADAPVEYFNLQGVRVAEPAHGIFIRRQGNSVSKLIK